MVLRYHRFALGVVRLWVFVVLSGLGAAQVSCSSRQRDFTMGTGGNTQTGGDTNTQPPGGEAAINGGDNNGGTNSDATGGTMSGNAAGGVGAGEQAGGEGGAPPIVPPEPGAPGLTLPAGGLVMKSTNYILLSTTGEGPGGQLAMSSPSFKLTTGLVGATQTR